MGSLSSHSLFCAETTFLRYSSTTFTHVSTGAEWWSAWVARIYSQALYLLHEPRLEDPALVNVQLSRDPEGAAAVCHK
jgi:hypothetical protein